MDFPNTKHFKIVIYNCCYQNKYYLSWIIVSIIALTEASGSLNTMNIVCLVNKLAFYQNQMTGIFMSYRLCWFLFCF